MAEVRDWLIRCNFATVGNGEFYSRPFRGTEDAVQETIGRMECPGDHTYEEAT